jgi:hypothetical protein
MQIKLTQDIANNNETCLTNEEYEAVLISPYSTTVEFVSHSGLKFRAFKYEYEIVDAEI